MKKVGIVCCSNGQLNNYKADIDALDLFLKEKGLLPVYSDYIFVKDSVGAGTARERADALMCFYKDDSVDAIFDISGGDIANEIIPYLDFEVIASSDKEFWGYSDLTTIINAIYTCTDKTSVLYQVKNVVWDTKGIQKQQFMNDEMYKFKYDFVQGNEMSGVLVGGNIRCFLKLAGTKYFPSTNDKILLLESLGGEEAQIRTYFAQLSSMGVLDAINGLLLGTFTEYQRNHSRDELITTIKEYVNDKLTIAITDEIGHSSSSKAMIIGKEYVLS